MKRVNKIFIGLVLIPFMAISQVSTSLSTSNACYGDNVVIAVNVKNYKNIGAISLAFKYDTAVLEYKGFTNLNKGVPNLSASAKNSGFFMGWAEITPANLSDGKLIDVQFKYKGGESIIYWDTINNKGGNCQIVNQNADLLKNSLTNTSIKSLSKVSFTKHPLNSTNCYHASDSMSASVSGTVSSYQWKRNGVDLIGENKRNLLFKNLESKNEGFYQVVAKDINGCGIISKAGLLKVNQPFDTTLTFIDGILSSNAKGLSYQWLMNKKILPNETSNSLRPIKVGGYSVVLYNNLCTDTSMVYSVLDISEHLYSNSLSKTVFTPNPSNGNFTISLLENVPLEVEIYDIVGNSVYNAVFTSVDKLVNLYDVQNGVYLVKLKTPTLTETKKIFINK